MRFSIFVLLLFVSFTVMTCTTGSTENEKVGIPNPHVDISLSFFDSNHKDLLNPENTPDWDKESLNIYDLKEDGPKVRADNSLDNPKGFTISYSEDQNCWYMNLGLSTYLIDGFTTTFIEFPAGTMDTLKLKGYRNEYGSIIGEKFWYNGELLWEQAEEGQNEPMYFEITKQVDDG